METQILSCLDGASHALAVVAACECLRKGEVVALPTETVYGLAGDALNPVAAARIFEAKERPFFDPLICHLPSKEWLEELTVIPADCRDVVQRLVSAFWPGPLTLVLPKRHCVPDLVSAGLPTVAVRWSANPLFQAVLSQFGRPLAAPSANRFGRISPTAAVHVRTELNGRIPLILDGGVTAHGVESTIVAADSHCLRILRSGPVTREELEKFARVEMDSGIKSKPEAPGQLLSHYAPATPLDLLCEGDLIEGHPKAGLLAWKTSRPGFGMVEVLSESGDLVEAAARLFASLRRLDESGVEKIYAEPVPKQGLGAAINDRLQRAAAR